MIRATRTLSAFVGAIALSTLAETPAASADEGFEVFRPFVEINASAGDVGFHYLLDGGAWKLAQMFDADGTRILDVKGTDDLLEQGMTELFMESAEPPCWKAPDVDADEVVTVADFIERFEKGTYKVSGRNLAGELIAIQGVLTHNLPAAPIVQIAVNDHRVTINWKPGTNLGKCAVPPGIPSPANVKVVSWEVAVEPDEEALPGGKLPNGVPLAKLNMQLLGNARTLVVPAPYIESYLAKGVNEFKGEVGAKEKGGNQTFTELEFAIE
jgi:hypothetical protein